MSPRYRKLFTNFLLAGKPVEQPMRRRRSSLRPWSQKADDAREIAVLAGSVAVIFALAVIAVAVQVMAMTGVN